MSAARLIAMICLGSAGLLAACSQPGQGARPTPPAMAVSDIGSIPLGNPPGEPGSPAQAIRNPYEGDAEAIARGKALFGAMNCVYCHGAEGSGLIGPALNGHGWRYGGTPAEIFNSIHDGRPKGMPAWGRRLPPQEIWRLTAYIESLGGALPPATQAMASDGGPQQSTTGPQVAGQSSADTAARDLNSGDRGRRR